MVVLSLCRQTAIRILGSACVRELREYSAKQILCVSKYCVNERKKKYIIYSSVAVNHTQP